MFNYFFDCKSSRTNFKISQNKKDSNNPKNQVINYNIIEFDDENNKIEGMHNNFGKKKAPSFSHQQVFIVKDKKHRKYNFTSKSPFIWIGGVPRSGTTLMRVILDTHPQVRCGPEPALLSTIFNQRQQLNQIPGLLSLAKEAGVTEEIIDSSLTSGLLEMIISYAPPAPILCIKDPFLMLSAGYILKLFPNSKFILMIRDGRAVAHSILSSM